MSPAQEDGAELVAAAAVDAAAVAAAAVFSASSSARRVSAAADVGAEPLSVEERLEGLRLVAPRPTEEPGAAALGVDPARPTFLQGAGQAAAAAGLPHQLRAGGRQRLALLQSPQVAGLAPHHRPRSRFRSPALQQQQHQ